MRNHGRASLTLVVTSVAFGLCGVHCASILGVDHDYSVERGEAAIDAAIDGASDAALDAPNSGDSAAPQCDGGLCIASVIVPGLASPGRILATATALYWAVGVGEAPDGTSGAVWTSDLTGGSPHSISTGYANVTDLTIDGTTLYFVNQGNGFGDIDTCDLPSCGNKQTLATSDTAQSIRVTGGVAYWTGSLKGVNGIISCSTSDCSNGTGSILASTALATIDLSLSGSALLWSEAGSAGSIATCTLPSCARAPVATTANPGAVFLDGTSAFWLTDESVFTQTIAPTTPTTLASGQGAPNDLVVDASNAYWTNRTAGTVSRCSKTGCGGAPDVIASGLASPFGIAVTDSAVYVTTNATSGAVVRIPK